MKKSIEIFLARMQPLKLLILGYVAIVILGALILSLPICRIASVGFLDNLFTATSAVSTTGLVTKSLADDYSLLGRIMIILMIQIGGIGYMSVASFVVIGQGRKLSSESASMLKNDFSLPQSFNLESFIRNVVLFSISIELIGAAMLFPAFMHHGVLNGIWHAIFHSISAFCTAGFGLYNNSFENFRDNFGLNFVISALSYMGAIGFIVFTDIWDFFRGRKRRVTFTTEIILKFTLILSVAGTFLMFITEPSIRALSTENRLLASFFQAMTAMTTVGFNSIPVSGLAHSAIFLILLLMIVGASPSGTGGGIKSTTVTAVYAQMMSVLRSRTKVVFQNRIIPPHRLITASANFSFYILFLCAGAYLLLLTEPFPFDQVIFEATSAIGTVGLSTGITSSLTALGKIIVIVLMFAGRVGPLSIGTALFMGKDQKIHKDDLAI